MGDGRGNALPSNPKVLHQPEKLWVLPPGSKWMADAELGKPYEARETAKNDQMDGNDIIGKFNPGLGAQSFDIGGSGEADSQRFRPRL